MARYGSKPALCCPDCFAHPWLCEFVMGRAKSTGTSTGVPAAKASPAAGC